jgi:hypothetical protein
MMSSNKKTLNRSSLHAKNGRKKIKFLSCVYDDMNKF